MMDSFLEWLVVAKYLDPTRLQYKIPYYCLLLCSGFLVLACSTVGFLASKFGMSSVQVKDFAYVCSTLASIIYIFKRVPQIVETWKLQVTTECGAANVVESWIV